MNEELLKALEKAKEILEEGGFEIISSSADDGTTFCSIKIDAVPPKKEVSTNAFNIL